MVDVIKTEQEVAPAAQAQSLEHVVQVLGTALVQIFSMQGGTLRKKEWRDSQLILPKRQAFMEGSNAAFRVCAEIAAQALNAVGAQVAPQGAFNGATGGAQQGPLVGPDGKPLQQEAAPVVVGCQSGPVEALGACMTEVPDAKV